MLVVSVGVGICVGMGVWVRGCAGAWMRGCVDAWMRGCVGVGRRRRALRWESDIGVGQSGVKCRALGVALGCFFF